MLKNQALREKLPLVPAEVSSDPAHAPTSVPAAGQDAASLLACACVIWQQLALSVSKCLAAARRWKIPCHRLPRRPPACWLLSRDGGTPSGSMVLQPRPHPLPATSPSHNAAGSCHTGGRDRGPQAPPGAGSHPWGLSCPGFAPIS